MAALPGSDAVTDRVVNSLCLFRAEMLDRNGSKNRRDAIVYPRGVAKRAVDMSSRRPGVAKKTRSMMPRAMKGLA